MVLDVFEFLVLDISFNWFDEQNGINKNVLVRNHTFLNVFLVEFILNCMYALRNLNL